MYILYIGWLENNTVYIDLPKRNLRNVAITPYWLITGGHLNTDGVLYNCYIEPTTISLLVSYTKRSRISAERI